MGIARSLDRIVQAGGTGVTLAFWAMAIAGALLTVYGPLPIHLLPIVTGVSITIVWMRVQKITIVELLIRAGYTEARHGHRRR